MITTPRLLMVPASVELVKAENTGRSIVAGILRARVPDSWPPEALIDAFPWFYDKIKAAPDDACWYYWYALLVEPGEDLPVLAASCGFKGPPGADGAAEIGYSVLPEFHGKGIAQEMVSGLAGWAFAGHCLKVIVANASPENLASCAVLKKNGFLSAGDGDDPGTVRFALERGRYPVIEEARDPDLPAVLEVQKKAFASEARLYGACSVPPLTQTLDELREEFKTKRFLKAAIGERIAGSVRAWENDGICRVEKLIVEPEEQNKGIGSRLMCALEDIFPEAKRFELFTGHKSAKNIALYAKLGYRETGREKKSETLEFVHMAKERRWGGPAKPAARDFSVEASFWDAEPRRVKVAKEIVGAVVRAVPLSADMDVLDFGCGTGLVGMSIRPHVRSLTCVDNSSGMLEELRKKVAVAGVGNVNPALIDVSRGGVLQGEFHVVVTSLALHHIRDVSDVVKQFYRVLVPGGRVCIADLDADGGKFHDDPSGVYHNGFDRGEMRRIMSEAGFTDILDETAARVEKPSGTFSVFLFVGGKPR